MSEIRVGIVGSGFIFKWHYDGFMKNPDAKVVGVCAHEYTEKVKDLAENLNIKAYANFDEMVNDPNIDALVIASYNPLHYPQIMKAISCGKHLLVEKPVVTDLTHLDSIKKLSESKNVIVFPAHNFVYRGAMQEAKKIIENGGIGKVFYSSFLSTQTISEAHSRGWRSKLELSAGGALMDSGHHLVYMSLFLKGMPLKLQAFKSNLLLNQMEGEDIAQVNLLYADGTVGNIMQSWISVWSDGINGTKIFGDKGRILVTDALYYNNEKLSTDVGYAESFDNQAKAFTDCILKGKKPVSTLEDAKNALRVIYGAYESSDNNLVKTFD